MAQPDHPPNARAGWTSSGNDRGSADILWMCIATLFLCSWTVLHLNIPAPEEKFRILLRRHLKWMVLTLIGKL